MTSQSEETKLAIIANDIQYIKRDLHDMRVKQQQGLVSKEEFEPIKRIVYGLVGLILVAVVGGIMALVII